jgi:hypothetical protein
MHYKEEKISFPTFVGKRLYGRRNVRLHISAHVAEFVHIIKGHNPLNQVLMSQATFRRFQCSWSRDSTVGIATGFGLDGWGSEFWSHGRERFFSPPRHPERFLGPPNLLTNGYQGLFPGSKVAGAWSWSLSYKWCRGQECVDLNIHSPIHFHGVVLN